MARSRNIKPGFFANDELAELPALTRLFFIGMWTIADREGRLEDRPKKLKVEVLPYDECDAETMLAARWSWCAWGSLRLSWVATTAKIGDFRRNARVIKIYFLQHSTSGRHVQNKRNLRRVVIKRINEGNPLKKQAGVMSIVEELQAWLNTVHNFAHLSRYSDLSVPTLRSFQRRGIGKISTLEKLIEAKRNGPPPPHVSW